MINVSEAKKLVIENCNTAKVALLPLPEANGCILAETVVAEFDTPPFNQSAIDGYAFSYDSWDGKSELVVAGEIQAGNYSSDLLKPLETVRIYTGAPLPTGADTVIMQEKIIATGKSITIKDEQQ